MRPAAMSITEIVWSLLGDEIDWLSGETNASSGGPNTWPRPRTLGPGNPSGSAVRVNQSSRRSSSSAISTSRAAPADLTLVPDAPGRGGSSRKALARRDGALERARVRVTGAQGRSRQPQHD